MLLNCQKDKADKMETTSVTQFKAFRVALTSYDTGVSVSLSTADCRRLKQQLEQHIGRIELIENTQVQTFPNHLS